MKLDVVTQWVSGAGVPQVPPVQSLASRTVVNLTCIDGDGGFEVEGIENIGRVNELRNLYSYGFSTALSKRVKLTRSSAWEDSNLSSVMRGIERPSESVTVSGACIYRGSSGTWEGRCSPCDRSRRIGSPGKQTSKAWSMGFFPSQQEPVREHEIERSAGCQRSSESIVIWNGTSAILAEHSTESECKK